MTVFDPTPHPDERIEWLRAQVEDFIAPLGEQSPRRLVIVEFVRYMEQKFQPKKMFDR